MLDLIYAKALFSKECELVKPILNQNREIDLKECRHLLIDKDKVVKNDIILGKKYDSIIITGPNTGGKTVILKTLGLISLMAQSGMFVPCKKAILNVFDNVFVDIGDEQSIEQNLSTFSSHMTRIKQITDNLTPNSLVLLDEVGSGTDPKEGASLAIAIIKFIINHNALCITTTHYSDLKAFAFNQEKVINASVEFNTETLEPTYKLLIGVPGLSNALNISKRLGINSEILNDAQNLANESSNESDKLIKNIDKENENILKIKEEYNKKLEEFNLKLHHIKEEEDYLKKNKDMLMYKARLEAQEIIKDAKNKSKELLEGISSLKEAKAIEDKDLADLKFKARSIEIKKEEPKNLEALNVGDYVSIPSYSTSGTINSIKKDKYEVQVGQFKMMFKREELVLEHKKPKESNKIERKKPITTLNTEARPMKLDLRGYRYEEVAPALDIFIDQAYLARYNQVYIIHGFGTGAVREAVYKFLKTCKHVKSTRFGGEGEGLNGCTVVELK
jgi:DNA mismatch repair protein MutS2